jgi:putative SOS response-associated peptidase YedK
LCGRYFRRSDKQFIAEHFHLHGDLTGIILPDWDYNVAPSTHQPVIRHRRETGELMRWGLVPHFAKSLADFKGSSTINARGESVQKTPMCRIPFQRRRCLVPADGFYEWKKRGAASSPKTITRHDICFGGGWDFAALPGSELFCLSRAARSSACSFGANKLWVLFFSRDA